MTERDIIELAVELAEGIAQYFVSPEHALSKDAEAAVHYDRAQRIRKFAKRLVTPESTTPPTNPFSTPEIRRISKSMHEPNFEKAK